MPVLHAIELPCPPPSRLPWRNSHFMPLPSTHISQITPQIPPEQNCQMMQHLSKFFLEPMLPIPSSCPLPGTPKSPFLYLCSPPQYLVALSEVQVLSILDAVHHTPHSYSLPSTMLYVLTRDLDFTNPAPLPYHDILFIIHPVAEH